jgi:neutral ceramidase
MKQSTKIVATLQYEAAKKIYEDVTNRVNVHGSIKYSHQYINMTNYEVTIVENGQPKTVTTCPGALGFSFAAGTTDGPGAFDFTQGDTNGNPFWMLIRDMLRAPSRAQLSCHYPKPILLDVGETHFPYDWVPAIVETQMFKIGNIYLVGFPGELTTMSGRRMRNAIKQIADDGSTDTDNVAIVAGLSNVYTHYVATFEEYQMQRYEAASTIYGPHTLSAYIQQFSLLTKAMLTNSAVGDGPDPPLLIKGQISFNPPIVMDMPPFLRKMGECIREPYPRAYPGETIKATFIAGHPRNNPLRGGSFFVVERKPDNGGKYAKWETVATDADWSTEFRWVRPVPLLPNSEIDFTWEMPEDTPEGTYRIRHFGYYKPLLREPLPYTGTTKEFEVRKISSVSALMSRRPPPPQQKQKIRTVGDFWNAITGNSWPDREVKPNQQQPVVGSSAFMR